MPRSRSRAPLARAQSLFPLSAKAASCLCAVALAVTGVTVGAPPARAAALSVSFTDPVGDFANVSIDLVGMTLDFDNVTGDYTLTVLFDGANPFSGTFNVNANLLNGSISPLTLDPAFVGINEVPTAASPTTTLVFTGNAARLTSWSQGDTVANSDQTFGLPIGAPFSAFGSGVQSGGLGIDALSPAAALVVPEPSTAALLSLALVALALRKRRPW